MLKIIIETLRITIASFVFCDTENSDYLVDSLFFDSNLRA